MQNNRRHLLRSHKTKTFISRWILGLLAVGLLAGCGGGGGSNSNGSAALSSKTTASTSSVISSIASSQNSLSSLSSSGASSSISSTVSCAWQQPVELLAEGMTRIEAEYYDSCENAFLDKTPGNNGGALRTDDIDITEQLTASNGYYVSEMVSGEYMAYSIHVPQAGFYDVSFQVAANAGSALNLTLKSSIDANNETLITANTEGEWQTLTAQKMYLSDGEQTVTVTVNNGAGMLDYIEFNYADLPEQSPSTVVASMGIGINLGNTLDAYPNEGDWAPVAQPEYLEAFSSAGFKHVRIPVTWGSHVATTPPYAIDNAFLNRVEQVVDWALSQELYVIVNAHHEIWLKENYNVAGNKARFDAIWTQLAERLKNKPPRLMFEILNEPNGMTASEVDELNTRILSIIRARNPKRITVFSGNGYTSVNQLVGTQVPNDTALIGNFHSYDPWQFAGQCTRDWGTQQDYSALKAIYDKAKTWSENTGIPVMVNEFGAAHYDYQSPKNICNQSARINYLEAHVKNAHEHGFAATVWDDGQSFQVYDRLNDKWGAEQATLTSGN